MEETKIEEIDYSINLRDVFITDAIEKGTSEAAAKAMFETVGEKFCENMLDDMWTNWSENFPEVETGAVV